MLRASVGYGEALAQLTRLGDESGPVHVALSLFIFHIYFLLLDNSSDYSDTMR